MFDLVKNDMLNWNEFHIANSHQLKIGVYRFEYSI